jgi:hypothetical protein
VLGCEGKEGGMSMEELTWRGLWQSVHGKKRCHLLFIMPVSITANVVYFVVDELADALERLSRWMYRKLYAQKGGHE